MADRTPTPKEQYREIYERELPTTLKVLRAFPADKSTYKPHEKSNTALQLAWTFVVENNIVIAALKGPLDLSAAFPGPQGTYSDIIVTYEKSAKQLLDTLRGTPDSRLLETVKFPSGKGQIADYKVIDFMWFMLLDCIHHRGQLSTYIRPVGGKVPAIYGPSGDEPWN